MLGKPLVTHQTGPEGRIVKKVYVTAGCDIDRELYLAIAVDRTAAAPVMMASAEGGVEIEELAEEKPEAILRERIHPVKGLLPFQTRRLCKVSGSRGRRRRWREGHGRSRQAVHGARLFARGDQSADHDATGWRSSRSMRR